MIDAKGFRLNVGIILINQDGQVFWAKRIGQNAWQFPQGGMKSHETPEQAMYRELTEEVGLTRDHIKVLGVTQDWLYYHLPAHLVRHHRRPLCIGQKQRWFVLRLMGGEEDVRLNLSRQPEFDSWRWVNYWQPLQDVVPFKREVYAKALGELAPLVQQDTGKHVDARNYVLNTSYSITTRSCSIQKRLVIYSQL